MDRTHGPASGHDPTCFGCKILGWQGGLAAAMPTRRPTAAFHANRERQWAKDHQAVRTLAKQGITPRHTDGAHELAQRATTKQQIEMGAIT